MRASVAPFGRAVEYGLSDNDTFWQHTDYSEFSTQCSESVWDSMTSTELLIDATPSGVFLK